MSYQIAQLRHAYHHLVEDRMTAGIAVLASVIRSLERRPGSERKDKVEEADVEWLIEQIALAKAMWTAGADPDPDLVATHLQMPTARHLAQHLAKALAERDET